MDLSTILGQGARSFRKDFSGNVLPLSQSLYTLRSASRLQHLSCRATETREQASVSQQYYYNQHVGADMAAGRTSSIELRVVVSASEERGHEGYKFVWNGPQP